MDKKLVQELHNAVQTLGTEARVTELLAMGPDDETIAFCLCASAGRGNVAVVKLLLDAGAPVNYVFMDKTSLAQAVERGTLAEVELLLAAGADPNFLGTEKQKRDLAKNQPLLLAIAAQNPAMVAVLLAAGANPNFVTPTYDKPLDVARKKDSAEIIALLEGRGATIRTDADLDLDGATKLDRIERLREVLPTTAKQQRGWALVTAAQEGKAEALALILAHGDLEQDRLDSGVFGAAQCGSEPCLELVLDAGGKPDSDSRGSRLTALGQAASRGYAGCVRMLLAAGAAVDAPHSEGTALHAAIEGDRIEVLRLLLAAGANPNTHGFANKTALQLARGHKEAAALLKKAGADANAPAKLKAQVLKKLAKLRRDAWVPRLEAGAGEPGVSRFGGPPWLAAGEAWPACKQCKEPLAFVAQIALATAPAALTGVGLAQLFTCRSAGCYGCELARVVAGDNTGVAAERETFHARRVVEWTRVDDYPFRDTVLATLKLGVGDQYLADFCNAGDKLGGWPYWVQESNYRTSTEHLLLQLASDSAVPQKWGDNGIGYLLRSSESGALRFTWQSG